MVERIEVTGLREFRAGLRQMDRGLPREVRVVANEAADIVVTWARPMVPIGPAARGHALSSIRTASTQSAGRVKGGGARYPYYPWLDFGGRVGPQKSVHREVKRGGRYIFPAFTRNRPEILDNMREGLDRLAHRAGIRTRVR